MKKTNLSSLFSYFVVAAIVAAPIAAFANHEASHTLQQLQYQLASIQQTLSLLLAAKPIEPRGQTKKTPVTLPATPVTPARPAQPAQPATPAQPTPGTGQGATSAQPAIPAQPVQPATPPQSVPAAELCYPCPQSAMRQQTPLSPEAQAERKVAIEELQTKLQSLQTRVADLQRTTQAQEAISELELKLTRTLQRGSSGDDVKQLQEFLPTMNSQVQHSVDKRLAA